MATATLSQAKLATVASFPANYFLENFALRADNSALVTALNHKELWYVPPTAAAESVNPILLHTFEQLTLNPVEVEPDVFYLTTSNAYTDHKSSLYRIDLRKWSAGDPIQPQKVFDFPKEALHLTAVASLIPVPFLLPTQPLAWFGESICPRITKLPWLGSGCATRAWSTIQDK